MAVLQSCIWPITTHQVSNQSHSLKHIHLELNSAILSYFGVSFCTNFLAYWASPTYFINGYSVGSYGTIHTNIASAWRLISTWTLVWIQSANVEEQSLDITISRTSTFTDDIWFSRPIDIFCTTFITNSRFWCLLQYNSSMWSKESRRARLYPTFLLQHEKVFDDTGNQCECNDCCKFGCWL